MTKTTDPTPKVTTDKQQWTDVYMRSNFSDTGLYPTSGSLSHSPDIIPAGTSPTADPNVYITEEGWKKDYGGDTYAQLPNYIYLRGQNLGDKKTTGQFYLYYSPASLLSWPIDPLDPSKGWSKNPLTTSSGSQFYSFEVEGKAKLITKDPFRWIAEPISGSHYCLIGRVVTPDNPNPIPEIGKINDFAKYISDHPNLAWRNVSTINPQEPISSRTVEYSQGDEGGETLVVIKCTNCPVGSKVSFSSGSPGPDPLLNIDPVTVTTENGFTAGLTSNIPAGYSTFITYSWYSEGRDPLPNMKIELQAILPVNSNHELYSRGFDLLEYGVPARAIPNGGIGPTRGIALGSFEMVNLAMAKQQVSLIQPKIKISKPSFMIFSGANWVEERRSIFGSKFISKGISVVDNPAGEVTEQTVTILEEQTTKDAASEQTSVKFNTGPKGGTVYVLITANNIPVGCEVSFKGVSQQYPIDLPKTKVTQPNKFTTGIFINLPAEFETRIASFFYLNDLKLPEQASLELSAILLDNEDPEALDLTTLGMPREWAIKAGNNDGPGKGKLLGKVTTNLG